MFGSRWRRRIIEASQQFIASEERMNADLVGLAKDVQVCHRQVADLLHISIIPDQGRARPLLQEKRDSLILPIELCVEIMESREYQDPVTGRRVAIAKALYRQWQNFEHRIFRGGRTRVVALIGRDETGQLWQHFLPDDYMTKRLGQCERYLLQAGPDDEIIAAQRWIDWQRNQITNPTR
jgi:hypothetical protein